MPSGGLLDLVAHGIQDVFLIGNPQFSFFKSVYRRHTNFAIEPIRQIFNESPDFAKKVVCIIDKKADYVLALKANHPTLYHQVKQWFETAVAQDFQGIDVSYEKRIEQGHHRTAHVSRGDAGDIRQSRQGDRRRQRRHDRRPSV